MSLGGLSRHGASAAACAEGYVVGSDGDEGDGIARAAEPRPRPHDGGQFGSRLGRDDGPPVHGEAERVPRRVEAHLADGDSEW